MLQQFTFRFLGLFTLALFLGTMGCSPAGSSEQTEETEQTEAAGQAEQPAPAQDAATTAGLVNPNRATKEELAALPGMTDELVTPLLDQRPFLNMLDFHKVVSPSMDEAAADALYAKMFIPLNLNSASEEEILLIPGVGKKIAHEFEEYRPYKKMAQFRREMGKYVDEAEVARLEQYVFVPIDLNTATEEEILSIPGVGKKIAHEFEEYRPYKNIEQFRREMGKYVDEKEVARLERYVMISE